MKKFFIIPLLLIACNNKKSTQSASVGQSRVVAVYTNSDGSKTLDIMLRAIVKEVRYDSAKKQDYIYFDTLCGKPQLVPALDSTGKTTLDSAGKQKYTTAFFEIKKDSVNWRIAGVPLDELLKKN